MSKTFQVSTLSTMELGGGTIKRRKTCALLLVLGMAMCIIPSAEGTENQVASDGNVKIGLSENKNVLEVNAASKRVKVKSAKKKSAKKTKKIKSKKKSKKKSKHAKVKAAYRYRHSSYSASSNSGTWQDDPTLDGIMKAGSKFGYNGAHHTGAELEKYGAGDCWAMSDWLNTQFQNAGYQSKIIQYATGYSSRHRAVQVNRNGTWVTAPYRSYGYHYLFV